jgi:hypothetical protein
LDAAVGDLVAAALVDHTEWVVDVVVDGITARAPLRAGSRMAWTRLMHWG